MDKVEQAKPSDNLNSVRESLSNEFLYKTHSPDDSTKKPEGLPGQDPKTDSLPTLVIHNGHCGPDLNDLFKTKVKIPTGAEEIGAKQLNGN
jgi:hypothetical protein